MPAEQSVTVPARCGAARPLSATPLSVRSASEVLCAREYMHTPILVVTTCLLAKDERHA
jgi:hypothetical protein